MTSQQIVHLSLALATIALLAYGVGEVARRCGQPPVIGEVLLGVLLGPTLLAGALSDRLFPTDIRPFLTALANLGVALFMFTIGAEVNTRLLRGRLRIAGAVATGSIVLPLVLGSALGFYLIGRHPVADRTGFILFLGAAMSVTAFPVLARILADRGMQHTPLGNIALTCAALDDVLAWTLLAVIVSIIGAGSGTTWLPVLVVPYLPAMAFVVRPLLRRLLAERPGGDNGRMALVVTVFGLLASAAFTEWIGLHFIFGAFLFGCVMPRGAGHRSVTAQVGERISTLNGILLLPVFFIVAGLKVNLASMDGRDLVDLGLILTVAVGGKFVGAFAGARLAGMANRPATVLGLLINTRGLTELIILSVGVQLGLLDTGLYSLMVVMALVTTAMAGPLLQVVHRPAPAPAPLDAEPGAPLLTTGGDPAAG